MADMAMPAGASFAVTIEPAGGSDQPTGAVVAASS
jgi:anti-sigma-K factor RskA